MANPTGNFRATEGWGNPKEKDEYEFGADVKQTDYKKPTQVKQGVSAAADIIAKAGRGLKDTDAGLGSSRDRWGGDASGATGPDRDD